MPDYDDALLATSENLANINWDTLETGGMLSEGKHLVKINKVVGELHNFANYTGPQAVLQMIVLDSKTPEDIGKMQFDRINLPHPSEAQGNQNRRVLIASRLGLIEKGAKETAKINWKILEGVQCVITVIHKKGTGQNAGKTYANVDFSGYEGPEIWDSYKAGVTPGAPGGNGGAAQDSYADI